MPSGPHRGSTGVVQAQSQCTDWALMSLIDCSIIKWPTVEVKDRHCACQMYTRIRISPKAELYGFVACNRGCAGRVCGFDVRDGSAYSMSILGAGFGSWDSWQSRRILFVLFRSVDAARTSPSAVA